ncbi:MAG: co-chaperone DjlA [Gammaproteobacteria bacterium]|nr:co-chaperone DjlA [Gammaproteobacteria bacterium]
MIYGKLVAGAIGFLVLGPIGLLLGLLVGHSFDKGLRRTFQFGSPAQLERVRQSFSESCFSLLGHVAKADGQVSEQEIAQAELIMRQLGVQGDQRQAAIGFFQRGAAAGFQPEPLIAGFREQCSGHRQLTQTLLIFLISMAAADGEIASSEREVLQSCASFLGYGAAEFAHLLEMVQAQSHFHRGAKPPPNTDLLVDAYLALGVSRDCDDRSLKRAYRRLMSEHHPDKLIAQGVPEDMLKLGTEKSQEIQAAYELIRKQRKAIGRG